MLNTITPGLYINLDKRGNKVFIRVLPEEVETPKRKENVFISPEVKELKPGLFTCLDNNGDKVLVRDLSQPSNNF